MSNKSTLLFIVIIVALIAFAGGYWLGTEKTLKRLHTLSLQNPPVQTVMPTPKPAMNDDAGQALDNQKVSDASVIDEKSSDNSPVEDLGEQKDITESDLPITEDSSVDEIITFINSLDLTPTSSTNITNDIAKFAPALLVLRKAVENSPDNFQQILDYLLLAEGDDFPNYIFSVIRGANVPGKDDLIFNAINQLSTLGTPTANNRLLDLVYGSGQGLKNKQVLDAVKNIAVFNGSQQATRIYALDLYNPTN